MFRMINMDWRRIKTREDARAYLRKKLTGTFTYYYTPQEHFSMGSTGYEAFEPYIPVGIQRGELDLEEAVHVRRVLGFYRIQMTGKYFGLDVLKGPYRISLEPLDENGNTVRDPMPLDTDDFHYSADFPNRRYSEANK